MLRQTLLLLEVILLVLFTTVPVVAAFSSPLVPPSPAAATTSRSSSSSSSLPACHRVFVGGLTKICDRETLQQDLEDRYGPIQDVFVMRETSATPFAFADFVDEDHAAQAIADFTTTTTNNGRDGDETTGKGQSSLYQVIEAANPINPHGKSAQRKNEAHIDFDAKWRLAQSSTTMVQVNKSHRSRLQHFLDATYNIKVVTGFCTTSKNICLLGTNIDAHELQRLLDSLPFPVRVVKKLYSVDPRRLVVGTRLEALETCTQEITAILNDEHMNDDNGISGAENTPRRVRLNVFPPSLLQDLIGHLEEHRPELVDGLSPKALESTHTLNLVHFQTDMNDKNVWLMGVDDVNHASIIIREERKTESALQDSNNHDTKISTLICRAQSKIQEAFYRYTNGPLPDFSTRGGIAVDCGAAPGGWTQFIVDHCQGCDCIYSIDPGDLHPTVASHPTVDHLRMKVEDALSHIQSIQQQQQQSHGVVDLYVSDMCLHQMSEQVDMFLKARDMGVVGTGTFFVLTIKCVVGRSEASFEAQAAQQRARLEDVCRNLQTIHLFSNRSGERTIMGHVK